MIEGQELENIEIAIAEWERRKATVIYTDENVVNLTSQIEDNQTHINKLMEINRILRSSREHYEKEIVQKFTEDHPLVYNKNRLRILQEINQLKRYTDSTRKFYDHEHHIAEIKSKSAEQIAKINEPWYKRLKI